METCSDVRGMQAAADTWNMRLVGHSDLNGVGDAMQVIKRGQFVYVAHVGLSPLALTILDCADPANPRVVRQIEHPPNTHNHKVQIVGNVLIQNSESPISVAPPPIRPPSLASTSTPSTTPPIPAPSASTPCPAPGVHRIWSEEAPYAHIAVASPTWPAVPTTSSTSPTPPTPPWPVAVVDPRTKAGDAEPWDVASTGTMDNTAATPSPLSASTVPSPTATALTCPASTRLRPARHLRPEPAPGARAGLYMRDAGPVPMLRMYAVVSLTASTSRKSSPSASGHRHFCHVAPPSAVRRTVPLAPLAQATGHSRRSRHAGAPSRRWSGCPARRHGSGARPWRPP